MPAMAVEPWSCFIISGAKPSPSCGRAKLEYQPPRNSCITGRLWQSHENRLPSGSKARPKGLTWPWVQYSMCEPSGLNRYVLPELIVTCEPSLAVTVEVLE